VGREDPTEVVDSAALRRLGLERCGAEEIAVMRAAERLLEPLLVALGGADLAGVEVDVWSDYGAAPR
jgi:hypothetical protein